MATKDTKEAQSLNPRAIFSKTGKGVQEASGKTSHLSRSDRAVLKEIDGKTSVQDVAVKFDKIPAAKFDALIQQLDKDGFIREVSSGAAPEPITPVRRTTPPPKASPPAGEGLDFSRAAPPQKQGGGGDGDFLDFTQAISTPQPSAPKGPAVDLAAAARAQAEAKAKEQAAFDYKARQEAEAKAAAEAKAKAEAEARAKAEARARAEAEARAKAEAEARAKAEADARAKQAEIEAKAKQARDMALRMAAEAKAKAEAESKEKARLEAELKAKLEEERKAREEAEKRAAEAAERARKELEEKSRREAEELRQRLEAEMKAKLEQERKAREEEDRKRREEEDRRRKEEDERRAKERAKEEAERKQREEEDRKRRAKEEEERRARDEAERKRREEEDRRRKEEDERRAKERAKEEAERKQREEEDRKRRAKEEEERRARDEADRKRRDEDEDRRRRAREEDERREKEEAAARRAREEAEKPAPPAAPAAPAAADSGDLGSLLSDLDSFGQKEEEEQKAKEEAERKAKQEAEARARAEEERKRREEEERRRRQEEERRAQAEAERRAKEEEERRAKEEEKREEEKRKAEEDERKRKAKEAQEKKHAEERAAAAKSAEATMPPRRAPAQAAAKGDDIGVSDEDLDMADVKRDEAAISKEARVAARQREEEVAAALRAAPRPKNWGKPVAIALFVILLGGIGVLNFMPLGTADFEKAASAALGVPVKVSSARLSVLTGVKVNLEGVTVGDTKINLVRGYPEIGSIFGPKKAFSRLELEGVSATQAQLGAALFGKAGGADFRVGRIVIKGAKPTGPLELPALDIDATVGSDGSVQLVTLGGPITGRVTPNGNNASFELSSPSFTVPFVPALSLSDFGWKGTATPEGVTSSEFDGRAFEGVISGTARVRWGSNWTVEGDVRTRGVKVAVFAPTLVSEGKVEGRGNYTMSGSTPAKLGEAAHLEGSFKIENGVIGNVDLGRALQTGGAQTQGRTEFAELTGQGVYDKGAVQLRQLAISTRAMNASASLDIDQNGALAGKIGAEVKAGVQTLRAVLNISGNLQNPNVRK